MPDPMTEFLIDHYQILRDDANMLARELETRGYKGYYIRGGSGEKKPLDPNTRPTKFVWEKQT